MFDVVPAPPRVSPPVVRRRPAKHSVTSEPRPDGRGVVPALGPRVLRIQWQLPARLRRPVREELARQRRARVQRDAIVQFERRPLYADVTSGPPRSPSTTLGVPAVGVEHHTGDVYVHSRPELALPPPPYAGLVVRSFSSQSVPVRGGVLDGAAARAGRRRAERAASWPAVKTERRVAGSANRVAEAERDVPYAWSARERQTIVAGAKAQLGLDRQPLAFVETLDRERPAHQDEARPAGRPLGVVERPRRRFALPLHFSIFPFSRLFSRAETARPDTSPLTVKKKPLGER